MLKVLQAGQCKIETKPEIEGKSIESVVKTEHKNTEKKQTVTENRRMIIERKPLTEDKKPLTEDKKPMIEEMTLMIEEMKRDLMDQKREKEEAAIAEDLEVLQTLKQDSNFLPRHL